MVGAVLLEREQELATLGAVVDRARSGRGGLAIVEGEPGAGKSSLLAAACRRARDAGMRVLAARGSELERTLAFGVAGQIVEAAGVTVASAQASTQAYAVVQRLFDALVATIDDCGLVVAVDDAQWADEPSQRFLAHLALRFAELPVALLLAIRTGEQHAAADGVLDQLRGLPEAAFVTPPALSAGAVATLVRATLGDEVADDVVAACLRATGGNPFYLHELMRTIDAEPGCPTADRVGELAPPRVLRSLMVRLGRLGAEATAVGRALSVLGDGAPLRLVARLAGVELADAERAADALARARIVMAGEPLRFAHPVIAATLEADMGHFERARAHRHAAELLLAEETAPARVAAHLLRAPRQADAQAVDVLERAAADALGAGDPAVAAGLLARALEEPPPPERRARLALALAKAEALAGSPHATDRYELALAALAPGEQRAEALAELATLEHHRGDFLRSVELARRGRAELPGDHPGQERLLAIELSAGTLHTDTRAQTEAQVGPVIERSRAGRPPQDPALLALVVGWTGIADDPAFVRRLAEAAIAIDPLIDGSHGESMGWVAQALIWIDALELAERWLTSALATADRRGAVMAGAVAALNRAMVRHHRGHLEPAVADAERALDIYRYGWTSSPWSTPVLAATHLARGDEDAARAAIALGERAGAQSPEHAMLLEARAQLHLQSGDAAAALADALAARHHVETRYQTRQPRLWGWRRLAAVAAHRLGRGDEARAFVADDLAELRAIGPARQLGWSLTAAGVVAGGADGVELLREAVAVLRASPARLQRAESLIELGSALRRTGHRTEAREQLLAGLDLAAEIGARPLVTRAREELRAVGARPRRTARSGVGALTPSERRVAELAAQGLSTPQIADALFVTRNTVETHLKHVYRKLDVRGRAQLPAVLAGGAESA